MSVTLVAPDLVRVLTNVLLFTSNAWPVLRIRVDDSELVALGTDAYAIGSDRMPAHGGPLEGDVWLHRDEAEVIVKHARALKKKGLLSVTSQMFSHTTAWTFHEDEGPIVTEYVPAANMTSNFGVLDGILHDLTEKHPALPERLELDKTRLAWFTRVKTGTSQASLRVMVHDNRKPVLISVGSTFRGALVPIDAPDGWLDE